MVQVMTLIEMSIIALLGAFGGWLASLITRGHGIHAVGAVLIGISGAILGGMAFKGMDAGPIIFYFGGLFVAFVGAVALLVLVGAVRGTFAFTDKGDS